LNPIHALVASAIVGLAVVFGVAATTKTVGSGASKPATSQVSNKTIAGRQRKLDRAQAALRTARAQKPPALPAVPPVSRAQPVSQAVSQPMPVSSSSAPSSSDDSHDGEGSDD
jgi:hypothetical protein